MAANLRGISDRGMILAHGKTGGSGGDGHPGPGGFEEVSHTADRALLVWGQDFRTLLVQAARGVAWLMGGGTDYPGPLPIRRPLVIEAVDRESLLVEWLGELAFSAESHRELFYAFDFARLTDRSLSVVAWGRQVRRVHTLIKAVTYHNLQIVSSGRGLETTVVFDV